VVTAVDFITVWGRFVVPSTATVFSSLHDPGLLVRPQGLFGE
jgi:hypothetical protein